jgi:pyruvate dehydrogenase E1 component alpha subunit
MCIRDRHQKLLDRGVSEEELNKIRAEVEEEVQEAVDYALEAPWPDIAEAYTDVYKA